MPVVITAAPGSATTTSTQLSSKQILLADLQASSALTGVLVTWNRPNWDHNEHEAIAVTDIDNTLAWSQIGQRNREENYVIKVECDVYREGTDAQGAETRLDALLAAVQAAVQADYTFQSAGVATVTWAFVERLTSTVTANGSGYLAHGEADVAVRARI